MYIYSILVQARIVRLVLYGSYCTFVCIYGDVCRCSLCFIHKLCISWLSEYYNLRDNFSWNIWIYFCMQWKNIKFKCLVIYHKYSLECVFLSTKDRFPKNYTIFVVRALPANSCDTIDNIVLCRKLLWERVNILRSVRKSVIEWKCEIRGWVRHSVWDDKRKRRFDAVHEFFKVLWVMQNGIVGGLKMLECEVT